MGKTEIKVSCNDQVLKITEAPVLASGGLNEVRVIFSFCEKWVGFTKTAIFYRDEEDVYYAVLDENDTCVVPWEVCYEEGTFYFGVFGEKDNTRRTSNVVRHKVKRGAITSGMLPSEPSPAVYEQIVEMLGEIRETANHNIASIEKTGTEGLVDTYTITFIDGSTQTYTVTNGENGKDGADGKDGISATHSWSGTTLSITSASGTSSADLKGEAGKDGITPRIGANGNWWIGETDTGTKAQGEKGEKGDKGDPGADGSDYVLTDDDKQEIAGLVGGGGASVTLDKTLSIEGQAADSKAVGDAIATMNHLTATDDGDGIITLRYSPLTPASEGVF